MSRRSTTFDGINKIVGQNIKLLRKYGGYSAEVLAKRIGVSKHQISKYENGISGLSASNLSLIARVMGKDISYFFEGIDLKAGIDIAEHQTLHLELANNFMKIQSYKQQEAINQLIKSIANSS